MARKRKGRRMINNQGGSQSSGRKPLEVPDLNSVDKTENTEPSTEEKEELEKAIDKELENQEENQGEDSQEETEETEDVEGEESTPDEDNSENEDNSDDSDNTQGEETEKTGNDKEDKDSENKDGKKKDSDDKDGEKKSESNKGNGGTSGGGGVGASPTPSKDGSNDTAKDKKLDPEDLKDKWKRRGKGLKDWFINVGKATKYGLKNLGVTLLKVLRRVIKIVVVVAPIVLILSFVNAVFEVYGPQYFADDCGVGNAPIFDAKWDDKKTEDAVMSYLVDSSGGDRMVGGILTEYVKATSGTKETWSSTGELDTTYDTIDVKKYVHDHPDVRVGLFGLSGDTLIEYLESLGGNTDWYSSDKQLDFVGKKLGNISVKEKEIDSQLEHGNTMVKQLTQKERIEARLGITMSGSEYTRYEKAGTERVKSYKGNTTNCKPYGHGKGFKGSGTAIALAGEFSSPILNHKLVPGDVNSWFGYRTPPTGASGNFHEGIDIPGGNDPLTPVAEGIVTAVKHDVDGYGTHVIFKLTDPKFNDASVIYGHMSRIDVQVGDHVKPGDILGLRGTTGNSTGTHLHVTLLNKNGQYVNPAGYFFGPEYANKDNGSGIKPPYDKTHL